MRMAGLSARGGAYYHVTELIRNYSADMEMARKRARSLAGRINLRNIIIFTMGMGRSARLAVGATNQELYA
jgi:hypothetical protein